MKQSCETLFYCKPASDWNQALPIGNGKLGAMIFGGYAEEHLALNLGTLWSGRPERNFNLDLKKVLPEARALIDAGRYADADELLTNHLGHVDSASYMTAGSFKFNFLNNGMFSDYERGLDLDSAVCHVDMNSYENKYHREIFASHPDNVIAIRLTAKDKGTLSFSARFLSEISGSASGCGGNTISFDMAMPVLCRNSNLLWFDEQGHTGVACRMHAEFVPHGGKLEIRNGIAQFIGGDSIEVFLSIASNFKDWKTNPEESGIDQASEAVKIAHAAAEKGYDAVLERHLADYRSLYRRSVMLMPDSETERLPTDERLESARTSESFSPALAALLYNFGRYLTISASRPGSQAMNLQGIWSNRLFAPWASNYTTNINLEMNYWPTEGANLPECVQPLIDFIFEVSEKGTQAAKAIYGLDGWCLFHNSDLWRFATTATGAARWGLWPFASGWLCRHLSDHIRYSDDDAFKAKAFEIILSAAKFYVGYLVERDGVLTTSPSTSPENDFPEPGTNKMSCVAFGSQMDRSIIRDVFDSVLEFAPSLNRADDPLVQAVADARARLAPPKIGRFGELLEYGEAFEENDVHHRHLSHLYGAYPGTEFTPDHNPEFYNACNVTLNRRGDLSTGWAMGWRAALRARFCHPEKLLAVIKNFLTPVGFGKVPVHPGGGIYANLFDAHPPFQIDGNFGITAALLETFMQSHRKNKDGLMLIEFFPALPKEWKSGALSGIRAPHGLTADLTWNGADRRVALRADREVRFELNGKVVHMKAGETISVTC